MPPPGSPEPSRPAPARPAARVVAEVLADWELAARSGGAPTNPPSEALRAVALAIEAGQAVDALRLLNAVRAVADRDPAAAEELGGLPGWSRWRELGALPVHFPGPALEILLAAALAGDPASARLPLLDDTRPGAMLAYDTLRLRAPDLFAAVFGWDPRVRVPPTRAAAWALLGIPAVLVGGLVAIALAWDPAPPAPTGTGSDLETATSMACAALSPSPTHPVCVAARQVRDALAEGRCEQARVSWARFRKAHAAAVNAGEVPPDGEVARAALYTFAAELEWACPR